MNDLLSEVKRLNEQTTKRAGRTLIYVEISMLVIGILLLAIDADQFATVSALLIFFAFVMFIITLFMLVLHATRNMETKIANTIKIAYKKHIDTYNEEAKTTYAFHTDANPTEPWLLVPSYAGKSCRYVLRDDFIELYHAESYTQAGNPPRKTYFFQGLYIIMEGPSGDLQYSDQDRLSGRIINAFKGIYGKDEHDIDRFPYRTSHASGTFYAQSETEVPKLFRDLIGVLKKKPYVRSLRIALMNRRLHIAVEQTEIRLPYIKKYQERKLREIGGVVRENATLLDEIRGVVRPLM
jgi:hypothetical protein